MYLMQGSHALAGLRVGYAMAHPELIEGLTRVKDSFNSYPLDSLAQAAAKAAIEDVDWYRNAADVVIQSRLAMTRGLRDMQFTVLPSLANFVFAKHGSVPGKVLFEALRERGILVRRWDIPRIIDWLRISMGTLEETDQFLRAVAEILDDNR